MPKYSLGEIDALARKATRGAGYSWGIAEEAGKAVRWLSAYGFSGAEALAQYLQMVEDTKLDLVPKLSNENSQEIVFDNHDGILCSLYCGALINDLGHQINANKTLIFKDMSFPLLALSATGRIAEANEMTVSFSYNQLTIILNSKGIVLNDTPPLLSDITFLSSENLKRTYAKLNDNSFLSVKNDLGIYAELDAFNSARKADVVCQRFQSNLSITHYPSPQSRSISQGVLEVLEKFAHTTYAPATAESRMRGAGEG